MTQNIDRAVRELFSTEGRQTRNIKYFFRNGENTADQLADYRLRALHQINHGQSQENVELDSSILD
jgi:hypothetical protein